MFRKHLLLIATSALVQACAAHHELVTETPAPVAEPAPESPTAALPTNLQPEVPLPLAPGGVEPQPGVAVVVGAGGIYVEGGRLIELGAGGAVGEVERKGQLITALYGRLLEVEERGGPGPQMHIAQDIPDATAIMVLYTLGQAGWDGYQQMVLDPQTGALRALPRVFEKVEASDTEEGALLMELIGAEAQG